MDAIARFIVKFRNVLLALFVILAIASVAGILATTINKDMTAYLPEDMQSKIGTDLMSEEFGDSSQFNVMYKGLAADQRGGIDDDLADLPHVTAVQHEENSDFVNGDASLYVVVSEGDTYSREADETLSSIRDYSDNRGFEYYIDSAVIDGQPFDLTLPILIGMICVITIMVIMSHAWIETPMLLAVVGIAILLNMGTNFIFESVSDTTFSIAAVLQLILSLDYSLMLLSRYRAERTMTDDKIAAVETALAKASRSIASSSITTIVGLVCLIFMSFTIGADMGLVLAKGVFMSLLCVFAIMPAIIVACDKLLISTKKPSPVPTMQRVTNGVHELRIPLTVLFCCLLGIGLFYRNATGVTFFMASENPDRPAIQEYFDLDNQIVVLYRTDEEGRFSSLIDEIESDDRITSLSSYGNTIGMQKPAATMAEDMNMETPFIKLLYYHHFSNKMNPMTPHQFALFLRDEVLTNKTFSKEAGDVNASDANSLVNLTDSSQIKANRTASSMVDYLTQGSSSGMSASDMQSLYLAYYMKNGGIELGTMTLPQFVSFMQNDVKNSKELSGQVSSSDMKQINQMAPYTNVSSMTKKRNASSMANLLGMDASQVEQLYKAHAVASGTVDTGTMTIEEFLDFLLNDVATNAEYSSLITDEMKTQIGEAMAKLPEEALKAEYDAKAMAEMLAPIGIEKTAIDNLYLYHWMLYGDASKLTMSCQEFLAYLVNDVAKNPGYADQFDKKTIANLTQVKSIVDASVAGTAFTPAKLASFLGMDKADAKQLYLYRQWLHGGKSSWTLNALSVVNFLISESKGGGLLDGQLSASDLTRMQGLGNLMKASVDKTKCSPKKMTSLMKPLASNMSSNNMKLLYLLRGSMHDYDKSWTMSLDEFLTYLKTEVVKNSLFANSLSKSDKADINDGYKQMMEGKEKLVANTYSMAVITVPYTDESNEMRGFLTDLRSTLDDTLSEDYLIGQGPMALEMSASFTDEFNFISLLTAIAIFLIVAITFKSLFIPLLLVLLIQCAFCLTMALNSLLGSDIYYTALIVVQAILMGACVDYAILFTNNYREARRNNPVRQSIGRAYYGSIRTMLTSGTVLVTVTAILGIGCSGIVGQICLVISQGCAIALLLVMFILPALLAVLDRFIMGKKEKLTDSNDDSVKVYPLK